MMPEISGLVPLRGVRGRVRVYLDEEYALTISKKNAESLGLRIGQAADSQTILQAVGEDEKKRALNSALYYLGRAERSQAQVVRYLEAREYPAAVIDGVMEKIDGYGYVNDARFAGMLLYNRAKVKGKSRRAIRHEMREKGLDENTIEDSMAQYDDRDELENAMQIARKYHARNPGDRAAFKRKAGAALARRGYDWDVIHEALREVQKEAGEDV